MGVVAPISAVGAALLPVCVGVATGERPALLVWLGIAAAVPGIWLVQPRARRPGDLAAGILDGVLAGLGFGLLFAATGQVPEEAGFAPLAVGQAVGMVAVALTATALGGRWVPYDRSHAWGVVAGLLAIAAVVAFLLATQTGLLTVASVLTSLYPAVTIALAAVGAARADPRPTGRRAPAVRARRRSRRRRPDGASGAQAGGDRQAPAAALRRPVDDPGEPSVGSAILTDTRTRSGVSRHARSIRTRTEFLMPQLDFAS